MQKIALYFTIKWLLYITWCYMGMVYLKTQHKKPVLVGVLLGSLRLLISYIAAIPIWISSNLGFVLLTHIPFIPTMLAIYLLIYLPIRWLEWGIIEIIIYRPSRSPLGFLMGSDTKARYWRLGGVIVSCLLDVPILIACGSILLGRHVC